MKVNLTMSSVLRLAGILTAAGLLGWPTTAMAEGPVAQWHADGNAEDASGNANHGTTFGTARFAQGLSGQAFELDGKASYVATRADTHPDNKPFMTWSAWVLPRKVGGVRQILSSYWDGWCRSILIHDGKFVVYTGEGVFPTTEDADPGVWQHIAVTFTPEETRFYKNGIESIRKQNMGLNGRVAPLHIGRNPRCEEFFSGLIDEVEIFDRALESDEVVALYEKYSKEAAAIAPEAVADADEPEAAMGIGEAAITPISAKERPAPEATMAAAKPTAEPQATPQAAPQAAPVAQTAYTPSGAESPAVAQAISAGDPAALAEILHKERWDNPADPIPTKLSGKLSRLVGKPSLVLFFVSGGADAWAKPGIAQKALDQLQAVADSEPGKKGKINVLVVTPESPEKIKKYFADNGINLPVIYDPEDTIRREMGLYSLPMLLLDAQGNIVWQTRMGERAAAAAGDPPDYNQADLDDVVTRVATGKYLFKADPAPFANKPPNETTIFDFEKPLEGWTLLGDCWGEDGQTSEKRYPGLVKGFLGRKWLSSFAGPASSGTGIAVSPEFTVSQRYLHLVTGGGDLHMKEGVALVCNGTTIKTATGKNSYEMAPVVWDLKPWIGKKARLIAYDAGKVEMRNGIMLDAVTASDLPQPPAAFKNLHDPNNAAHAAKVAADIPEDYKAIQAGNFHISSTPGKTFEIEWSWKVKLVEGARTFYDEGLAFPNTVGQTIHKQGFKLEMGRKSFQSKMIPTGKAVCTETKALELPLNQVGKSPFHRDKTILTVNVLRLERGPNPNFEPLPKKAREALTAPTPDGYPYDHPVIKKVLEKDGMRRWPGETDPAYLLRLWRYVQRYWTGNGGKWDGYPITPNVPYGVYNWEQKSLACPTAADMTTALRAAGIPAVEGQGWWLNETGGDCTGHVRGLVFLDKVGWILIDDAKGLDRPFGPYTFGNTWGDNYAQIIWDESPVYPQRKQWPTAGMDVTPIAPHGSFKSRLTE